MMTQPNVPPLNEIIRKTRQGVVQILNGKKVGSSFVVSPAGYIITNAHVVNNAKNEIWEGKTVKVRFLGNVDVEGTIIAHGIKGRKNQVDLACLHVEKLPFSIPLTLADSKKLEQGQTAVTMGYPIPGQVKEQMLVANGIVSANNPEMITHTAATNPGNSGGPLTDAYGHVIGVCTSVIQYSKEEEKQPIQAINLAVPANEILRLFPFLKQKPQSAEKATPATSSPERQAPTNGIPILDGQYAIAPPAAWQLTPGPQGNFARLQSGPSAITLKIQEVDASLQSFANLQRQIIATQAATWRNSQVSKIQAGKNPKYPSRSFESQGDFKDGKGVFHSRHYYSQCPPRNGKRRILCATLTTPENSPDHKAGLNLILSNFLSKLQPGPQA